LVDVAPHASLALFLKDTPCPFDDRAHIEPFSGQSAFPIIHIIGNALWLDVPVADRAWERAAACLSRLCRPDRFAQGQI
jgi:hypothetical protein